MSIIIDKENKLFTLLTAKSMYQMKVDDIHVLLHTYYGKKTAVWDYSYLIPYADRGFSGNPYEKGNERTYSLDALPQEYPSYGSGDFRQSAIKVEYADGSSACELRFAGYETVEGKYSLPGLPAIYDGGETKADTLIMELQDTREQIRIKLFYGVMEDLDVITRAVVIENIGAEPFCLKEIMSTCVDIQSGEYEMMSLYGTHARERIPQRTQLPHGITSIGSTRGASSHQYNPFFLLCEKGTDEDQGNCYGFSFLYSGDFRGAAELDTYEQTRVILGIHPGNFSYRLQPGECFYAPEAAMAFSSDGMGALSRIYHRAYRNHLCRGKFKKAKRPVLLNSWEGVYFDFDGKKLVQMAKEAAQLGVELFVMDDGWFGKRDSDISGLGDWQVNEKKLGCTLADLSGEIHKLGMKFGIWFEPECISEDSELFRKHPDWAFTIPKKAPVLSRNQLVLDFSRKDVRDYILGEMCKVLDHAQIEYLKWDFNRSITDIYSAHLPSDRQGETAHRYVLGLYDILEQLNQRYPDMLIEGCSGGGGRFDAGMLYYTPQIWCSDDTDAIERLSIQYGTSFGYPISTNGSHVSQCPNEQTGRITPLETRATAAMAGTFGYELDVNQMDEKEKETVKAQIQEFHKYYDLIQNGDYYRLTNPEHHNGFHAWEFAAEDGSEALLCVVSLAIHPNAPSGVVKVKGLEENSIYLVNGRKYPGGALMAGGILLPQAVTEYESFRIYISKIS